MPEALGLAAAELFRVVRPYRVVDAFTGRTLARFSHLRAALDWAEMRRDPARDRSEWAVMREGEIVAPAEGGRQP